MKTPREVLLEQHQAANPKLDAIRVKALAEAACPPAPEALSWMEWARSLRWQFAALGAAWVVVLMLNTDDSPSLVAMIPRDKIPPAQQLWASLRENRRRLQEFSDTPVTDMTAVQGRRSEIAVERVEV